MLEVGSLRKAAHGIEDNKAYDNLFLIDQLVVLKSRFIETGEVTLILVIACQFLVDINHVLGKEAKRGEAELQKTAGRMVRVLNGRNSIEGDVIPDEWPAANDVQIDRFVLHAQYWRDFDLRVLARKRKNVDLEGATCRLMERHPVLCGLLLFQMRMLYQEIGLAIANMWRSIEFTAVLHHACQFSPPPPGEPALTDWPDMDLVMAIHDKKSLFGGSIPNTLEQTKSAHLFMQGYSKEMIQFQEIRGTGRPLPPHLRKRDFNTHSANGPKGLQDHSQILPLFRNRYYAGVETSLEYDIKVIQKLLYDIQSRNKQAEENTKDDKGKIVKKRKLRRERRHKGEKFSVIQLLSVLEEGLLSETLSLRFDYISMHIRCLTLLRNVKQATNEYLTIQAGSEYQQKPNLPFLVGWILRYAVMGEKAEKYGILQRTNPDGDEPSISSATATRKMLADAADQVRALLLKEGEKNSETMLIVSEG